MIVVPVHGRDVGEVAQRALLAQRPALGAGQLAFVATGGHEAGSDGGHRDPVGCHGEGRGLPEGVQRGFGGAVGGEARLAAEGTPEADVDDRPSAASYGRARSASVAPLEQWTATQSPRRAEASAVARPIPPEAPVTSTLLGAGPELEGWLAGRRSRSRRGRA